MTKFKVGEDDAVVCFDRGDVFAEVLVRGGKSMSFNEVCDEARAIIGLEIARVGGGFEVVKEPTGG